MLVSVIITRVQNTLIDPTGQFWTQPELIDYLNGGTSYVSQLKPDAFVVTGNVSLIAGINQTLPAGGLQFMRGLVNVADKTSIILRDAEKLNSAFPTWAAQAQSVDVQNAMPDNRDPTRFLVNPPNNGSGQILATYGAVPTAVASLSDTIPLPDVYQTALWAYVVAVALSKNSSKQDIPKANFFFEICTKAIGAQTQVQAADMPIKQIPDLTV